MRDMTQPLRNTKYARELATAKLPSGPDGTSYVAIERIFVKQFKQIEIRFSSWEGSRIMPRPLDLPEEELLPLLRAACQAGVFSEAFIHGLQSLIAELAGKSPAAGELSELDRIQIHFHALIRARAGGLIRENAPDLPRLSTDLGSENEPAWYPVDAMHGGFKYWWDRSSTGLRLMTESWSDDVAGSGQLHEVTLAGPRLLGEGFV